MGLEDLFDPLPEAADAPRAGTYQLLRRGRPAQPVRILFGPPVDPDTGEVMDRGWRWQMWVSGQLVEADPVFGADEDDWSATRWGDVWPQCAGDPIPYPEYRYLLERIRHAQLHDEDDPYARPSRKIDLRTATVPE